MRRAILTPPLGELPSNPLSHATPLPLPLGEVSKIKDFGRRGVSCQLSQRESQEGPAVNQFHTAVCRSQM